MITFSKDFRNGLRDGVPIGLGYFSVAFTFGLAAVAAGLPVWGPVLISMTNVTSAGQFAGLGPSADFYDYCDLCRAVCRFAGDFRLRRFFGVGSFPVDY